MLFHLSVRTSFPDRLSNAKNNACVSSSITSTYLNAPSNKFRTTAVPSQRTSFTNNTRSFTGWLITSLQSKATFTENGGKLSPHAFHHRNISLLAFSEVAANSEGLVTICAWMETVSPACHNAHNHSSAPVPLPPNASSVARYQPYRAM